MQQITKNPKKRSHVRYKWLYSFLLLLPLLLLSFMGTYQAEKRIDTNDSMEIGSISPIRVAFDPYLPPFQYIEDQEYRGFNIELLQKIADTEGIDIQLIPMTLSESVDALEHGDIEVILGLHYKADFYERMEFTERFFTSSIIMLIPKEEQEIESISDLSERIVALQRDTLEYDFLQNIRRIKYHITSNQVDALRLLTQGRADAFVGNRRTAEYLLREQGVEDDYLFVERYVLPLEYTMAVDQQNHSLLQTLNRGLQTNMVNGTYKQLYDYWFYDESTTLRKSLEKTIQIFVAVGAVAVAIFLLGLRWNRHLKKQVDKKAKDLLLLNQSLAMQVQETKNSQQLKEQILESSPRGIVTCNHNGVITSINAQAIKLGNLNDKPIGEMYHTLPILVDLLAGKLESVMQQGKQFHGEDKFVLEKDERFLRYYVYPLYDYKSNIDGTILSFEDITDERKVREQLFEQEKSRALIQLVAGVAHEIRNPLTSIKTFVELIPSKINNSRFQQEIVTHVPKEIERLNHLIEELINYAKPKSMTREPINIAELIQSSIVLFQRVVENKGFSIQAELAPQLIIKADSNQLKQVMINLILNSIEALEDKYKEAKKSPSSASKDENDIWIRAWSEEESGAKRVLIQVQDQGIGMSKIQLKRIMEPFYTTKAQGTGLGLALSHQFVQENDGFINVESEEGIGTTITLSFRKEKEDGEESVNN